MTAAAEPTGARGAYGLRLLDATGRGLVADASPWLLVAEDRWPHWEIAVGTSPAIPGAPPTPPRSTLGPDRAELRTEAGGRIVLDRVAARTLLEPAEPLTPDALVHPYLASTAAVAAHWLGRAPFHAGAFALGGRAWGVLGTREMGKSSLLLGVHRAGLDVLADDVVVVEGGSVLCGPRCLDLRRPAAERWSLGRPLGRVGRRERWRVDLGPVPASLPLTGWVVLGWSETVVVEELGAAQALGALAQSRAVTAPGVTPHGLLDLVTLPTVLFARPRQWDSFDEGVDRLVEHLGRGPDRRAA